MSTSEFWYRSCDFFNDELDLLLEDDEEGEIVTVLPNGVRYVIGLLYPSQIPGFWLLETTVEGSGEENVFTLTEEQVRALLAQIKEEYGDKTSVCED